MASSSTVTDTYRKMELGTTRTAGNILLTSTGPSCQNQGAALGEYLSQETQTNGSVSYKQRHTVGGKCYFLYRLEDGTWGISDRLGNSVQHSLNLHNPTKSQTLPDSAWWCWCLGIGEWREDPELMTSSTSTTPCSQIRIDVEQVTRPMSEYFHPTFEYSCGRPVYTNGERGKAKYLHMGYGYHYGWRVRDSDGNTTSDPGHISSLLSTGSQCPADPRNGNWEGKSGSDEISASITCREHDYSYGIDWANQSPRVKEMIKDFKDLLGHQTITEMLLREDVIATVIKMILCNISEDIRSSLKKEFPDHHFEVFNSLNKVFTYLKDIIQSGSGSINRTKRSRLFITGNQGCGKSSLTHYLRYLDIYHKLFLS